MPSRSQCEECGRMFVNETGLFTHQRKHCKGAKRGIKEALSDARAYWNRLTSKRRRTESPPRCPTLLNRPTQVRLSMVNIFDGWQAHKFDRKAPVQATRRPTRPPTLRLTTGSQQYHPTLLRPEDPSETVGLPFTNPPPSQQLVSFPLLTILQAANLHWPPPHQLIRK